ncbi:MAG: sugar phosphate nucleotidyltransferase, partial [Candidatus Babeliales bacterium]
MIKRNVQALVLAAGKSKRCQTGRNKLAEKMCGQELILYPTKLLSSMHIATTVIVGHQQESIRALIAQEHDNEIECVTQPAQRGTADAVACSQDSWTKEHILIINGDIPLLRRSTIEDLYKKHIKTQATVSFVTAHYDQASECYGRVITKGKKTTVIEAAEFTEDPTIFCCISAGIYLIRKDFLLKEIKLIKPSAISQELYISQIINKAQEQKETITTLAAPFDTVRGVNDL